jgi:hypothetical protein
VKYKLFLKFVKNHWTLLDRYCTVHGVHYCDNFRLLMDQGNGVAELYSDQTVTEGLWHNITAVLRPDRLV